MGDILQPVSCYVLWIQDNIKQHSQRHQTQNQNKTVSTHRRTKSQSAKHEQVTPSIYQLAQNKINLARSTNICIH